ncbi:helix-turn-helix transcriptional regulator [Alkalilimnicola ehrlichii]|uniref:helix-turn-helix transcriptional regulator n=1 Tax=Alkalilimnicola ehrlichii TaxID=351052 RepID=UPI0015F26E67|nr:AraC family transcriptional regulator [Alkalilimnicola ehrlichii]
MARRIRESSLENIPLSQFADAVRLSTSRLEKLFKEQVGLPITQYRTRYRVFISSILMALGHSMTEAALSAGFSSSAHLSRAYRAINGMTPSAVFLKPPCLNTIVDRSALNVVAPVLAGKRAM